MDEKILSKILQIELKNTSKRSLTMIKLDIVYRFKGGSIDTNQIFDEWAHGQKSHGHPP